jgi:Aspartyl protease
LHRLFVGLGTLILVGSGTSGASLAATLPENPSHYSDHSIPRVTIPVKVYRGFLVVAQGQFGETLEHENFILDTGTSPSILNRRLAKQLGLAISSGREAEMSGVRASQLALLPELQIGPIHVKSLPFVVMDLSRLERDLGIPIAGQLGLDVLGRSSFRLDYQLRVLDFGEVEPKGLSVPLDPSSPVAVLRATVDGESIRLLVDTGTNRLVVFGRRSGQPLSRAFSVPAREASMAAGLTIETRRVDLQMANAKFSVDKAYLIPRSEDSLFDGVVGVQALGVQSIAFDSKSRTLYLSH